MNQYVILLELTSTEIYHFAVSADSKEEAEAKVLARYPNPPHIMYVGAANEYVGETTTFTE
jgi:hypothetical protein